jgi:hypothetical protein
MGRGIFHELSDGYLFSFSFCTLAHVGHLLGFGS